MQLYADLHSHSTASDGVDAPARVSERAAAAGLAVYALTDHDSVDGVAEAAARGRELGIAVVPGIEMTCYVGSREIHVLGYFLDIDDAALRDHCRHFQRARDERAAAIARRLEECGAPIDIDAVRRDADGGSIGRPHVAKALLAAGHVATMQEAFERFLGEGKPANVPKPEVAPRTVVDIIRAAGGIAVHAHPALGDQFDLIPMLAQAGVAGIEAFHSNHDFSATNKVLEAAYARGLAVTGGSDCHGALPGRESILGRYGLDESRWRSFLRHVRGADAGFP